MEYNLFKKKEINMAKIRKYNNQPLDSRERIDIVDIAKNSKYPTMKDLHPDDWEGFRVVQDKEGSFDAEKGFIDHEIVIQRKSDDKYFKFTYTQYGYNGSDCLEQTAVECARKEKTV